MKRVLPIVLAGPLVLIGAAYPDEKMDYHAAAGPAPAAVATGYRPCRPGPGDDRCIQLYERGVRASYARWMRGREVEPARNEIAAVGGPVEEPTYARHRPYDGDGHRCHDDADRRHGAAHGM
jgi:hypothetical protein